MVISTVEEYDTLKSKTLYSFLCRNCGKEVEAKKSESLVYRESQKLFLCKTCKSKKTFKEKYGVDNPMKSKEVQKKCGESLKAYWEKLPEDIKLQKSQEGKQLWESYSETKKETISKKHSEDRLNFLSTLTEERRSSIGLEISKSLTEFWASLSKEDRQSYIDKAIKGRKGYFESLTEEDKLHLSFIHKQAWDNISDEKKQEIAKKIGEKSKRFWSFLSKEEKLKISKKQQETWKGKPPEEKLEIRRKSNKHNKYKSQDGEVFDSKWELLYYEYCKSKGYEIIREPISLQYEYEGTTHFYFPDFSVNGKLVEVKGNHLKGKGGKWVCPYKDERHSKEYMDGLYEAKRQCALKNNVTILYKEDLMDLEVL